MIGKAIIRYTLLTINTFFVLAAIIGLSGSFISPEKIILPAFLPLFFPIILLGNFIFAFFWLLLRRRYFLASFITILLSIPALHNIYSVKEKKESKTKAETELVVLTYNTMMNAKLKKHTAGSHNKVIDYILQSNADVVCLQEFAVSTNKNFLTESDINTAFKDYPYKHIVYKDINKKIKRMGLATFSKYPIVEKNTVKYSSRSNGSIYTDIKVDSTIIRVINNHLESNRITAEHDKALMHMFNQKLDVEQLSDITVDVSRKMGAAYKIRAVQADMIADIIRQSPHKVIACGDFNDVPISYTYHKVKGNLEDSFHHSGAGLGLTYCNGIYRIRIDYILHDKKFSSSRYQTDKVYYSDHFPLKCHIALNKL